MSHLLRLKPFFTLEEAATYLSNTFDEGISLATLYQLIADKRLALSVRVVNQVYALKGQIFECSDGDLVEFKVDLATGKVLEKPYFDYVTDDNSIPVSSKEWFVFDNKAHVIDGIWDFAMIGEGSLKIEDLYQNEVNGPVPIFTDTWGFYIKQGDIVCRLITRSKERFCKIQESIDEEYEFRASLRDMSVCDFTSFIEEHPDMLSEDEIGMLDHFNYLINLSDDSLDLYEDSRHLDENSCQLIIKANELSKLIQSLDMEVAPQRQRNESLSKERPTFLLLLYILLKEQGIEPYKRGVTSSIRLMTENTGYPLSQNTIRSVLGQICNALDSSIHEVQELSTKERQTFLKFLYALLKEQKIEPSKNGVASLLLKKASAAGYPLLEDTVCSIVNQVIDFIG